MNPRHPILFVILSVSGCVPTPAPAVIKGTFTKSYTLTMQRGAIDVVVRTSGPATYEITNHRMSHPMGPRPDTEATFVTPAGTFVISNRDLQEAGLMINAAFYPEPPSVAGRSTLTIDAKGVVTLFTPSAPKAGGPGP